MSEEGVARTGVVLAVFPQAGTASWRRQQARWGSMCSCLLRTGADEQLVRVIAGALGLAGEAGSVQQGRLLVVRVSCCQGSLRSGGRWLAGDCGRPAGTPHVVSRQYDLGLPDAVKDACAR